MSTDANAEDVTTRAEHHADSSEAAVRTAKDTIAWILARRDCREWAISSAALADATTVKATTVRDIVKELRGERGLPIVSCSRGYYCLTDEAQLADEIERIDDEIQTRRETKQELVAAFNRRKYGGDE